MKMSRSTSKLDPLLYNILRVLDVIVHSIINVGEEQEIVHPTNTRSKIKCSVIGWGDVKISVQFKLKTEKGVHSPHMPLLLPTMSREKI